MFAEGSARSSRRRSWRNCAAGGARCLQGARFLPLEFGHRGRTRGRGFLSGPKLDGCIQAPSAALVARLCSLQQAALVRSSRGRAFVRGRRPGPGPPFSSHTAASGPGLDRPAWSDIPFTAEIETRLTSHHNLSGPFDASAACLFATLAIAATAAPHAHPAAENRPPYQRPSGPRGPDANGIAGRSVTSASSGQARPPPIRRAPSCSASTRPSRSKSRLRAADSMLGRGRHGDHGVPSVSNRRRQGSSTRERPAVRCQPPRQPQDARRAGCAAVRPVVTHGLSKTR